jgi:MFS family permease
MVTDQETLSPPTRLGGEFHKLWAASGLSNLGDGIWLVAAPLLAATLTRDPVLIAGLSFTQQLPWLIFPLLSGALADRIDRRKAMVSVTMFRAALVLLLGLAVMTGRINLPFLYIVFFLLTTGETLFDTSSTALIPGIVPRERLTTANARLSGTVMVMNLFLGRPIGGFLSARVASLPFTLGAAGLAVAAAVLTTLRGSFGPAVRDRGGSLRRDIGEGLRWLGRHRLLRTTAVTLGVLNLVLVAQNAIMVLYAQERLGLGATGYGFLLTATGLGGIVGSVLAPRILTFTGEAGYLRLAVIIEAVFPAIIALTSSAWVVGADMFLFGVHATTWGAVLVSLRQELTPDPLRGRVQSVHGLIEYGTAAPGALLGGLLAAWLGLTAPFWFSTIAALVLLVFVWPVYTEKTIADAREAAAS